MSEVNAAQISAGGLVVEQIVSAGAAADSMIRFELMTLKEAWTGMSWLVLSLEVFGNMLKEELRFKMKSICIHLLHQGHVHLPLHESWLQSAPQY